MQINDSDREPQGHSTPSSEGSEKISQPGPEPETIGQAEAHGEPPPDPSILGRLYYARSGQRVCPVAIRPDGKYTVHVWNPSKPAEPFSETWMWPKIMANLSLVPFTAGSDGGKPKKAEGITLAVVRKAVGDQAWLWEGWIPLRSMLLLLAEPGTGKTRFALSLATTLATGGNFPDGTPSPFPAGSKTLYMLVDGNYVSALKYVTELGLSDEYVIIPADEENPFARPGIESPQDIAYLENLVAIHDIKLIIVDSITYQSELNTGKTADATRAFKPIVDLAVRRGLVVVAISHTNNQGEVLNKRLKEIARTQMRISQPDPDIEVLKLEVDKSDFAPPKPLGMRHTESGFEFSDPPEATRRGRKATVAGKAVTWLLRYLEAQPSQLKPMFQAAEEQENMKAPVLYRARDQINNDPDSEWEIHEFESINDKGSRCKYWNRTRKGEPPPEPDRRAPFIDFALAASFLDEA
jgi:hypothetical protein